MGKAGRTFAFLIFTAVVLFLASITRVPETSGDAAIESSLKLAQKWFLNNVNPQTGLLEYSYDPDKDTYSEKNNDIRQLGTLWAMTELEDFLDGSSLAPLIERALRHYENDHPSIAHKAFLVLALLNPPDYPNRNNLMSQMAVEILNEQQENGSFKTDRPVSQDYYPGEAMLALMKLYEETKNRKYLNAVVKALPHYRNYWRENKNTAFVSWQTQAYFLAYKETKNKELSNFIFEMNDWLVEQNIKAAHYMEGVNDAYSLAVILGDQERIKRYGEAIKHGTEFILSTQVTQKNPEAESKLRYGAGSFPNPKRAIGGFMKSPGEHMQRIDYTQHAVMALIKTHKNKIF